MNILSRDRLLLFTSTVSAAVLASIMALYARGDFQLSDIVFSDSHGDSGSGAGSGSGSGAAGGEGGDPDDEDWGDENGDDRLDEREKRKIQEQWERNYANYSDKKLIETRGHLNEAIEKLKQLRHLSRDWLERANIDLQIENKECMIRAVDKLLGRTGGLN